MPRIGKLLILFIFCGLLTRCGEKPDESVQPISPSPKQEPLQSGPSSYFDLGPGPDRGVAVAVDNREGVMVAAKAGNDIALLRADGDGRLDPLFGVDGVERVDFNAGVDTPYALKLGQDGLSFVVGTTMGAYSQLVISAHRADGSLEQSFHYPNSFWKKGQFAYEKDTEGRAIAIDQAGRIYVVGRKFYLGSWNLLSFRLLPDGKIDSTYKVMTAKVGHGLTGPLSAVVDEHNRLFVVGQTVRSLQNDAFLLRLQPNGTLDPKFGDKGILYFDFGGDDAFRSVALDSQERLVAVGQSLLEESHQTVAARFSLEGELDIRFGASGMVMRRYAEPAYAHSVAILPGDAVGVVGRTQKSGVGVSVVELIASTGAIPKAPKYLTAPTSSFARSVAFNGFTSRMMIVGYGAPVQGESYQVTLRELAVTDSDFEFVLEWGESLTDVSPQSNDSAMCQPLRNPNNFAHFTSFYTPVSPT